MLRHSPRRRRCRRRGGRTSRRFWHRPFLILPKSAWNKPCLRRRQPNWPRSGRDLTAYGELLDRETGQTIVDPTRLVVPILERFIGCLPCNPCHQPS
ncbi:DUF2274 domain-containing protein [Rhizobium tibeticum]|uniref:DUF2274 domain-containing protein n=1 Tax=Rhizobium tibeticum TaxID=501024 RepID=UPI0009315D34